MSGSAPRDDLRAAMLVDLVPWLPKHTAVGLERMLAAAIAAPTSAQLRQAKLGLLLDMLHSADGVVPSTEDYEMMRTLRAAEGEQWPAASTLIAAYGRWIAVVRCAMRLAVVGSSQRVPASLHHTRHDAAGAAPGRNAAGPYTRQDVTDAIAACMRCINGRPTGNEYVKWTQLTRRVARLNGMQPPRLPSLKRIGVLYGGFEAAADAATRITRDLSSWTSEDR